MCLLVTSQQACPQLRQHAVISFTSRPKNVFFAPRGREAALINVKFGTGYRIGPLLRTKFHIYMCRIVGLQPPKPSKFGILPLKIAPRGESLAHFNEILSICARQLVASAFSFGRFRWTVNLYAFTLRLMGVFFHKFNSP